MKTPEKSTRHARQIEQIQEEIAALQESSRVVTTPQELEALEQEIRALTDSLGTALLGQKVQASLDSDAVTEAAEALVQKHPKRLKSEGKKTSQSARHSVRKSK